MKVNANTSGIQQSLSQATHGKDRVSSSRDIAGEASSGVSEAMLQSSARVNISEKAKEMQRVKELAKQAPDVDAEKVAKFRALIANGEYKVDAQAIADRMLEDELSLASAQS